MNLFEDLQKAIEKEIGNNENKIRNLSNEEKGNITKEEIELANKLNAIEEFTVDRIEGNIIVLEDRENNNMINVRKEELPLDIKEGDILKKINGKYFIDENLTQETEERIKKKMDDLWN